MKNVAHQYEDKLLEFAYGELPQHEADAVDAHVRGCNRCAQSLQEIRGVRAAMAQLPMEPAPDAGLESLLAYAEQAAKRNAAEAKPAPSFFKKFLMPLASLAALVTVGVVGFRASQEFDTSPASAVADQKLAKMEEAKKLDEAMGKAPERQEAGPKPVAQAESPKPVELPPVAAAQPPSADPAPANKAIENKPSDKSLALAKNEAPRDALDDSKLAAKEGRAYDEIANVQQAGKLDTRRGDRNDNGSYGQAGGDSAGEAWKPEPKSAPQSNAKRAQKLDPMPKGNAEQAYQQQWSDREMRGANLKDVIAKEPPPPPPAPPAQEKPSYGYGLGTPGGSGSAATGGASTRGGLEDAPQGLSSLGTKSPVVNAPPKVEPKVDDSRQAAVLAEKQREAEKKEMAAAEAEESKARKQAEEAYRQRAAVQQPAPVAAAPQASPPPPSSPSSSYAPTAAKKKSSMGIFERSTTSASADNDDEPPVADSLLADSNAKTEELKRKQFVTQSVENARVASSRGNRMEEIRLLAQALERGASGYEKVEALKRICDAYNALGEQERADPFCEQLVQEFPNTAAAQAVLSNRMKAQRAAPKKAAPPASPSEQRRVSDEKKAIDAAPASAY